MLLDAGGRAKWCVPHVCPHPQGSKLVSLFAPEMSRQPLGRAVPELLVRHVGIGGTPSQASTPEAHCSLIVVPSGLGVGGGILSTLQDWETDAEHQLEIPCLGSCGRPKRRLVTKWKTGVEDDLGRLVRA